MQSTHWGCTPCREYSARFSVELQVQHELVGRTKNTPPPPDDDRLMIFSRVNSLWVCSGHSVVLMSDPPITLQILHPGFCCFPSSRAQCTVNVTQWVFCSWCCFCYLRAATTVPKTCILATKVYTRLVTDSSWSASHQTAFFWKGRNREWNPLCDQISLQNHGDKIEMYLSIKYQEVSFSDRLFGETATILLH